ncbi:MAG: pseudouridine synthase [Candidatus Pacebacteria bacterium]|nr:pseudouridine synthase [Candidatus Paceibacterota bacterium]MDR3583201.1 pseudouridine synthase [Candidatus Paceibacterota bacterium]
MEFPMRINKYLAQKNIASRREADELIKAGQVKINEQPAKLGDLVQEADQVTFSNEKKCVYYALNKPARLVTHSPQKGEKSILETVKFPVKVFPLGRLDKDSRGLIILTNDGRVTDKLLNPENEHEKKYLVEVNKAITKEFLQKMRDGVKLDDGYRTKKCAVKREMPNFFSITLTEGKKRQIRRMCSALGYRVVDLVRTSIMNIHLNDLPEGQFRPIKKTELQKFLQNLGL